MNFTKERYQSIDIYYHLFILETMSVHFAAVIFLRFCQQDWIFQF